ncbi:MAG: hypothetical protein K9N11_10470, partial [Lentisphaeria bacterium]|nr:hypothetical protein [Lentisphaeria bacterium]
GQAVRTPVVIQPGKLQKVILFSRPWSSQFGNRSIKGMVFIQIISSPACISMRALHGKLQRNLYQLVLSSILRGNRQI